MSHLKNKEDEKKQNETALGENCCACPKSEEEERHEEEERMFQIEFENFLHNNVYVKRFGTSVYINSAIHQSGGRLQPVRGTASN